MLAIIYFITMWHENMNWSILLKVKMEWGNIPPSPPLSIDVNFSTVNIVAVNAYTNIKGV